ncbi:hypothetical protein BKA69DRAFT_465842 [Paraphysoderma sedebokerense]|nr:hypothetical protein BKA69DRAFT_465842 [Paraphysoderma sedebokerense]
MPRLDSSKPKGTKLFIWISAFGKDTPILGAAYLELTLSEPIKNPDLRDKKPPSQIAPQPTQPKGSTPKSNPPSSNPAPANPPSNSSSPLQPTSSSSPITTTQILTITTTTPTVTTITTIENNTPVVFTTSTMATVVLTSTSIGTVMPTGTPGISDSLEGSQNISPWKVTGINDSQGDREIGIAGDAAGRQNDPNREAGDEARGTLDNIKKKFGSGAKSLRWEIQSSGLTLGLVGLLVFW